MDVPGWRHEDGSDTALLIVQLAGISLRAHTFIQGGSLTRDRQTCANVAYAPGLCYWNVPHAPGPGPLLLECWQYVDDYSSRVAQLHAGWSQAIVSQLVERNCKLLSPNGKATYLFQSSGRVRISTLPFIFHENTFKCAHGKIVMYSAWCKPTGSIYLYSHNYVSLPTW